MVKTDCEHINTLQTHYKCWQCCILKKNHHHSVSFYLPLYYWAVVKKKWNNKKLTSPNSIAIIVDNF